MDQALRDAYLAGIIDGEGCVGVFRSFDGRTGRHKFYYRAHLIVVQKNPAIPLWIRFYYGGSLDKVKQKKGFSPGSYYRWAVYGSKCGELLKQVRPYLLMKVDKADRVIALQEHIDHYKHEMRKFAINDRSQVLTADVQLEREKLFRAAAETKPEDFQDVDLSTFVKDAIVQAYA